MLTMLLEFCTSSNPIALKLTIDSSFLDGYWIVTLTLILLPKVIFRAHLTTNAWWCMFSSSIQHYIIWIGKCLLLVHIILEIHPFGILDEFLLSPSDTSPSPPWFNDELLFQEPTPIVHFLRILQCHFIDLCCTFSSRTFWVWGIMTPIRSESRSDMMVGTTFQELWCWSFDDPVIWCHA